MGSLSFMCLKLAFAATAVMTLAVAAPALAWGPKPSPAPAPAASNGQPAKAGAEDRAAAERMDPLGRAAFWSSQFAIDPKDIEAGLRLSAALRAIGRSEEAGNTVQQLLVIYPNNVEVLLESARVAVQSGQGFFAVAPAQKAAALAPKDWRAPSLMAVGLAQIGRTAEALQQHQKALALAPDNPNALSNAAMFYAAQGDKAQAETLLRKAVKSPDASVKVRQNLAMILGLQGKFDEAELLQRQDVPPQMAEANMAYLKAAAGDQPVAGK